jgi:hypothetical protein
MNRTYRFGVRAGILMEAGDVTHLKLGETIQS